MPSADSNKKQYRILDITIEMTVMNLKKLIFEETGTPVASMGLALYDKKKKKVADLTSNGAIMSSFFPTTALGATDNWFVYVMDSSVADDISLVAKMHKEVERTPAHAVPARPRKPCSGATDAPSAGGPSQRTAPDDG